MLKLRQGKEKYMCNGKCCGGCVGTKIAKTLLIVGGLNWGLVGIGMLMNSNLNVLEMIFGSIPTLEAIIYVLVGVAAIMKIFGCKCSKCKAVCSSCAHGASDEKMDEKM